MSQIEDEYYVLLLVLVSLIQSLKKDSSPILHFLIHKVFLSLIGLILKKDSSVISMIHNPKS